MSAAERVAELREAAKRQREGLETEVRKANARISGFNSCLEALGASGEAAGAKRKLEDRVASEEAEIKKWKQQIEESLERDYAFDEASKILARKGKEPELRPDSMMAKVRELIRQAGRAMTLVEIAKALDLDKGKKNSVRGSLSSYARDQRVFVRGDGPETFTLIEFKHAGKIENGN